jgi:hypothetical protein
MLPKEIEIILGSRVAFDGDHHDADKGSHWEYSIWGHGY